MPTERWTGNKRVYSAADYVERLGKPKPQNNCAGSLQIQKSYDLTGVYFISVLCLYRDVCKEVLSVPMKHFAPSYSKYWSQLIVLFCVKKPRQLWLSLINSEVTPVCSVCVSLLGLFWLSCTCFDVLYVIPEVCQSGSEKTLQAVATEMSPNDFQSVALCSL